MGVFEGNSTVSMRFFSCGEDWQRIYSFCLIFRPFGYRWMVHRIDDEPIPYEFTSGKKFKQFFFRVKPPKIKHTTRILRFPSWVMWPSVCRWKKLRETKLFVKKVLSKFNEVIGESNGLLPHRIVKTWT